MEKFLLLFGPEQLSSGVSSDPPDSFFYKRNRFLDSSIESNQLVKISLIFAYFDFV